MSKSIEIENKRGISDILKSNRKTISLGFLGVSLLSLVYSIRKRTRGTSDFGMQRLMNDPSLQGNIQHASWMWALQAFGLSTALVGASACGIAITVGHYMNVSSLKEFSVEFRNSIHKKFPSLAIEYNEQKEVEATREFMKEWRGELDNEKSNPSKHVSYISGIIADGLGPLGKFTSGTSSSSKSQ